MARPKLGDSETQRLQLKITEEEIAAIDEWRFENRVPSRSEAVRRLVKIALTLDAAREGFSDAMMAKAKAEDGVFDIAMMKVRESIEADGYAPDTNALLEAIKRYMDADEALRANIREIFDEINFVQFSSNPFVAADRLAEVKAKTLEAISEALDAIEEQERSEGKQ